MPSEIVAGNALLSIEDIARIFNTNTHTVGQWITDGVHEEWRYRSSPAWPRPIYLRGSATNEGHWYSKFSADLRFTIREVATFLCKCANSELTHTADGDSPLRPPVNVRFTKGVTIINGIPLGHLSCADYREAV